MVCLWLYLFVLIGVEVTPTLGYKDLSLIKATASGDENDISAVSDDIPHPPAGGEATFNSSYPVGEAWLRCINVSYPKHISTVDSLCTAYTNYQRCFKPIRHAVAQERDVFTPDISTRLPSLSLSKYLCSITPLTQRMQLYRDWTRCNWSVLGISTQIWFHSVQTCLAYIYSPFLPNLLRTLSLSVEQDVFCLRKEMLYELTQGLEGSCAGLQEFRKAFELHLSDYLDYGGLPPQLLDCHRKSFHAQQVFQYIDKDFIKMWEDKSLSPCHDINVFAHFQTCLALFLKHTAKAETFQEIPMTLCEESNIAENLLQCFEPIYRACAHPSSQAQYWELIGIKQLCQLYRLLQKYPDTLKDFQMAAYLATNGSTYTARFNNRLLFTPYEWSTLQYDSGALGFLPVMFEPVNYTAGLSLFLKFIQGKHADLAKLLGDMLHLSRRHHVDPIGFIYPNLPYGPVVGKMVYAYIAQFAYALKLPMAQVKHLGVKGFIKGNGNW